MPRSKFLAQRAGNVKGQAGRAWRVAHAVLFSQVGWDRRHSTRVLRGTCPVGRLVCEEKDLTQRLERSAEFAEMRDFADFERNDEVGLRIGRGGVLRIQNVN